MARLVVVSFRLGGVDGVSIEAAKWIAAFRSLGHEVSTLAGSGIADVVMPELAMDASGPPRYDELRRHLDDADVVVVENLVSLPFNRAASDALYDALRNRPAIFRHHDLAWQRPQWRDEPAPLTDPLWRHVTINHLSKDELRARGVDATTIYNAFDVDPPRGDRDTTRHELNLTSERLALFASRAIERKNLPGALATAEALGATLWLLGPAEDAYDRTAATLLRKSVVPVVRGLSPERTIHDAYAASDLVIVSSTWEGFGNPVLESITHQRPLAVYPYPVLSEILDFGFRFFDLDATSALEEFLHSPDASLFAENLELARRHFNLKDLPNLLARELHLVGVN